MKGYCTMTDMLFTSESVSEGHPDKIADQISDAVLDAVIKDDPHSRVACETLVKSGMILVAGEITTNAWADIEQLARDVVRNIGYTNPHYGFEAESCVVLNAIGRQSPDIALGVDQRSDKKLGAGDQGLMFGYATNFRSLTSGRANASMEFSKYLQVPGEIAQKVIEEKKKSEEEKG